MAQARRASPSGVLRRHRSVGSDMGVAIGAFGFDAAAQRLTLTLGCRGPAGGRPPRSSRVEFEVVVTGDGDADAGGTTQGQCNLG